MRRSLASKWVQVGLWLLITFNLVMFHKADLTGNGVLAGAMWLSVIFTVTTLVELALVLYGPKAKPYKLRNYWDDEDRRR